MDSYGIFEESVELLLAMSKRCDTLSSSKILDNVSQLTDMFYISPDPECSFGHILDLNISLEHIEKTINSVTLLMAQLRERGITSLGSDSRENTTQQIIILEKINRGMINLVDDVFRSSNKGVCLSAQGGLAHLDERYESILEDTKGLLFQLWHRFPKHELLRESETLCEYELLKVSLAKHRSPPSELDLEDFRCHTVTKKMWLKLDTSRSEFLFAVAPNKICKMCNDVLFTSQYDFIILDLCYHIFCGPCIRKKIKESIDG